MQHVDVLIIGGGPAGISAAVWCKRLGVAPNVELIKEKVTTTQSGLIVINEVHQSSNPSIYAIGDACTTPLFSSISSSAGQGAIVAKHLSSLLNE